MKRSTTKVTMASAVTKRIGAVLLIVVTSNTYAQLQWTNVSHVIINGPRLEKVANIQTAWNAGAISQQHTYSDGWVEFKFPEYKYAVMGLAQYNTSVNVTTVTYGIYAHINGYIYIYENGNRRAEVGKYSPIHPTYLPTDIFRVERIGNSVYYKKNGSVFYTSAIPSNGPLYVDCSFNMSRAAVVIHAYTFGIVWTGAVNENWNEPANWNLNRVPALGDQVIINSCTTCPTLQENASIGALQLTTGSSLNLSNHDLTVATVSSLNASELQSEKGKISSRDFMEIKNSQFNGSVVLEKTGGTLNTCYGGNKFSPEVKIINSSANEWEVAGQVENLIKTF